MYWIEKLHKILFYALSSSNNTHLPMPACALTQPIRRKSITPRMLSTQRMKTPCNSLFALGNRRNTHLKPAELDFRLRLCRHFPIGQFRLVRTMRDESTFFLQRKKVCDSFVQSVIGKRSCSIEYFRFILDDFCKRKSTQLSTILANSYTVFLFQNVRHSQLVKSRSSVHCAFDR